MKIHLGERVFLAYRLRHGTRLTAHMCRWCTAEVSGYLINSLYRRTYDPIALHLIIYLRGNLQ